MARVKAGGYTKPARPALTPENEEQECIALAYNLVKQRLQDGSASSQETTHFLKLATAKYRLESEILERQKELITAKTEALQSQKKTEELIGEALKAMRRYQGVKEDEIEEY